MATSLPKKAIYFPILLLLPIWIVFLFNLNGFLDDQCYGVIPRHLAGLKGILLSPLFHSGWEHILSNTFPLLFLSALSILLYDRITYLVVFFGWIFSGILLWFIGDLPWFDETVGCHIGASSVVYVLASFLFFSGLIRKDRNTMAASLIVIFLYGSFIWGILPEDMLPTLKMNANKNPISWEGHLSGFLVGFVLALYFRKLGPQKQTYYWEDENVYDPKAEALWQAYLELEEQKAQAQNQPNIHYHYTEATLLDQEEDKNDPKEEDN